MIRLTCTRHLGPGICNVQRTRHGSVHRSAPLAAGNHRNSHLEGFPIHIHHHVNIWMIFKSGQRKSKCPSLTVAPTRTTEHRTVPTDILQTALVDFSCKERVLSESGMFLSKCDDALPETV